MKKGLKIVLLLSIFLISLSQNAFCWYDNFYHDLEHLLYNYGNNPSGWPECEQKKRLSSDILVNENIALDECVFGENLLVFGISNSPDDAARDLAKGKYDDKGKPYDMILASSPDGNTMLDWSRAVGNDLGKEFYNKKLKGKHLYFLKADFHSQGAVVFREFNGITFTIMARDINIMGDPGSFYDCYKDDISRARSVAHCDKFKVWVGEKDFITKFPPNIRTAEEENLAGLKLEIKFGRGGTVKTNKALVEKAGHPMDQYNAGRRDRPVYEVLTSSKTSHYIVDDETFLGNEAVSTGDYINQKIWNTSQENDGWVVISQQGKLASDGVAILMTNPDDSPSVIAEKIRKRNNHEHPGEEAIVLLDGNPNSDRNKALVKALREKGYKDIFIVRDGDLYTVDGACVAHGEYFLPKEVEKDPVLAQGIWGHILRTYSGRPVYGDPVKKEAPAGSLGGVLINPAPVRKGKADTGTKRRVIQARPSEDSLSWPVTIPVMKEKKP